MMMSGGLLIWLIVMVLILLLVGCGVAAVVWFLAQGSRGSRSGVGQEARREDKALEILRERYARGEIDREEYERMRLELSR